MQLKKFIQTTISLAALIILFVFTVAAQTTTATITGRVVDGLGTAGCLAVRSGLWSAGRSSVHGTTRISVHLLIFGDD